jgi:mannose-6-phosphate isomerase
VLGKVLPPGDDYAESWELADHGSDQSVVSGGALQGKTLRELVRLGGPSLLGRHAPQDQFPLLFKFLDAQRNLSLQVHPDDEQAARLEPPDRGKTEAWIVLHADAGSRIYAGLKPGVDRITLEQAVRAGTAEQCVHRVVPHVGDCLLIPAGTVHAIGAGVVVAEIQQSSDTTFRLYDWNRLGPDGQPRTLHVQESLGVIDFHAGPVEPCRPQVTERDHVERLVACDKFVVDRWRLERPQVLDGDQRCHLLVVLEGAICLPHDAVQEPLTGGQTALLPAAMGGTPLLPQHAATLLDIYLP